MAVPRLSDNHPAGGGSDEGLVLLTGANGYLGRALSRRFIEDGFGVVLAVRSPAARPSWLRHSGLWPNAPDSYTSTWKKPTPSPAWSRRFGRASPASSTVRR